MCRRECYCGNAVNSGAGPIAASSCNMRCAGNIGKTQQMCGGSGALNMFYSPNP